MTNEQITISFPRRTLIKNSSSSSQMNIRSSKKMLLVSKSRKNSDLFTKKHKKSSTESGQSFSIKKIRLNQSIKYSNKKNFQNIKSHVTRNIHKRNIKKNKNKSEVSNIQKTKKSGNQTNIVVLDKYNNNLHLIGKYY